MKRYIKRLIDRFSEWNNKTDWFIKVGVSMGLLFGIAVFILTFKDTDKTPATEADFEPLMIQANAISHSPDLLFNKDCSITVHGEKIYVYLENDECRLTATYNHNFDILSISKADKSMHWGLVTLICLLFSFVVFYGTVILSIFVIGVFSDLWNWVSNKIKTKSKYKN